MAAENTLHSIRRHAPGPDALLVEKRWEMEQDAVEWAELIRKTQIGNRFALEMLLMRVQEVTYRFSVLVCGGADDAEDAMQEALIKTYRYVATIRKPEKFRAWLYRTVRNACLMGRRKRVDEPAELLSMDQWGAVDGVDCDTIDPSCDPEARLINACLRTRLGRAFQSMRRPYRAVVFLREIELLSTREVAEVLGISEANVKTRLRRAHLVLRETLERP